MWFAHGARFVPEAKAAGGAAVERSLGEGLRRSFGQDPIEVGDGAPAVGHGRQLAADEAQFLIATDGLETQRTQLRQRLVVSSQ